MKQKKKDTRTWFEKYGKTKKRMKYMKMFMRAYRKKQKLSTLQSVNK